MQPGAKVEFDGVPSGGMRWKNPYQKRVSSYDRMLASYGIRTITIAPPKPPHVPETCISASCFTSTPPLETRVGEEYIYQAQTFHANIVGCTWYLDQPVPGMTVERHSGKITWTPQEGGYYEIILCARNIYGATSRQSWTVCVRKGETTRQSVPNKRYQTAIQQKRLFKSPPVRIVWKAGKRSTDLVRQSQAPPVSRIRAGIPLRV